MKNVDLEKIGIIVDTTPILAIDLILNVVAKAKQINDRNCIPELLTLFCQSVLLSQDIDKKSWINDPKAGIFRREQSQNARRFIAVCLLRLFSVNEEFLNIDNSFHAKAFELFDDIFQEDIYKMNGIYKKDQTYIKESKLKDVVPAIEREIFATISSLNTLDTLAKQTFRKSVMDVLNHKKAQIVILPFLPPSFQDTRSLRLNELFGLLESYIKVPEVGMLQAFW